jgi:16S rRNA (cytosine967-C5)-methyltransferase
VPINPQKLSPARKAAFDILLAHYRRLSYANLALDAELNKRNLSTRDAALTAVIVYGVVERRLTLDYQLRQFLTKPLERIRPEIHIALLIGLYQIYFLDRVPDYSAIAQSVELVKTIPAIRSMSGIVNAVLRRAQASEIIYPEPAETGDAAIAYLSIRHSVPEWICRLWKAAYPDHAEAMLAASTGTADTYLRVNTEKTTTAALKDLLATNGVGAALVDDCENALCLTKMRTNVVKLPGFSDGCFHVQDISAQWACHALGARAGETVFDLCAAPGGKSFTLAQMMRNDGKLIACELHDKRTKLIESGANRLGLTCVQTVCGDVRNRGVIDGKYGKADRILCDVPCSGLGIMKKKPDIREKTQADLDKLPELQYNILCSGAECLNVCGVLLYVTCTLNPAENEGVCGRFLESHPDFDVLTPLPQFSTGIRSAEGFLTIPVSRNHDGFFMAKFQKRLIP